MVQLQLAHLHSPGLLMRYSGYIPTVMLHVRSSTIYVTFTQTYTSLGGTPFSTLAPGLILVPIATTFLKLPKGNTSPIFFAPPKCMTNLSMPAPHPLVGGNPISNTLTKYRCPGVNLSLTTSASRGCPNSSFSAASP